MEPGNYSEVADLMLKAAMDQTDGLSARVATARVLRLGCKALQALAADMLPDGDISWARRHLQHVDEAERDPRMLARVGNQLESYEIVTRRVSDAFLVAESAYFEKAGVPPDLRRFIITNARDFKREYWMTDLLSDPAWDGLRQRVEAMVVEVCQYSERLDKLNRARSLAKRGALTVAGAAVIKLNASADAILTGGLAPWMTAKSGKLGSWLLKKGSFEAPPTAEA